MVTALLVAGGLATPITGLLIRPNATGARHGMVMFVDIARFGWYGYVLAAAVMVTLAVIGVRAGTPAGRRRAVSLAGVLMGLTVALGAMHAWFVWHGVFLDRGQELLTAVAVTVAAAAVFALVTARSRLR